MKKLFFALVACVAMFAFSSCEKKDAQIFDLTYDETTGEQAEIMIYQNQYLPIFMEELAKVAKQPTESGRTFLIDNSTESEAKKIMKPAFEAASAKAQQAAGEPSAIKGFKVILNYQKGDGKSVEYLSYIFK